MYEMAINLKPFGLENFDFEAVNVSNGLFGIMKNSEAYMNKVRHSKCPLTEYSSANVEYVFGTVDHVCKHKDLGLITVAFNLCPGRKISSDEIEHFKNHPGDYSLKPRVIGSHLICFDLIRTGLYSKYTLVEKGE